VGIKAVINYVWMLLIGLACIAKAYVGDLVPDIAFVGLFGLLTVSSGLIFLTNFIDLIKYPQYNTWVSWLSVLFGVFPIMAYAVMTVILLLKDSFGGLYFAPAAIQVVQLIIRLIFCGFIDLTIMGFIFSAILIVGLFLLGKAVTDN
jgi:hypothetical protein